VTIHGGLWRVHASAVDDITLITDSLGWLCGDKDGVQVQRIKSALGAPMYCLECKMSAKVAKKSLRKIDSVSLLEWLSQGLQSRIDEDKVLHIRVGLEGLVMGTPFVIRSRNYGVVKGNFKLEVYPGQNPHDIAVNLIKDVAIK
jgi:RNA binding exosome subunit